MTLYSNEAKFLDFKERSAKMLEYLVKCCIFSGLVHGILIKESSVTAIYTILNKEHKFEKTYNREKTIPEGNHTIVHRHRDSCAIEALNSRMAPNELFC